MTEGSCDRAGDVICGSLCLPSTRCCLTDVAWTCAIGSACYTASNIIGCYEITTVEPTTPRSCLPSGSPTCPNDSCVYCDFSDYYFCAQSVYINTDVTLTSDYCTSSPGRFTIDKRPRTTSTSGLASGTEMTFLTPTSTIGDDCCTPPPPRLSNGAIAGIAIGGLALLVLITIAIILLCRRKPPADQPPPDPIQVSRAPPAFDDGIYVENKGSAVQNPPYPVPTQPAPHELQ